MEEYHNPEKASLPGSPLVITECSARDMITAVSHKTMSDLAVRHVFGVPPEPFVRAILEFIPMLKVLYGFAQTKKLTELLTKQFAIDVRQAHRHLQFAIDQGWVLPRAHSSDKRCTDNVYNPERKIPELLRQLNCLNLAIGRVVEAQLLAPLDTSVGRERLPPDVFMHPVLLLRAKHDAAQVGEPRTAR